MSWNIRWFPDGGPGKSPSEHPTDLEWLACALAYLNADVFALQELKAYPGARQKLDRVRARLDELAHGAHQTRLDDCDPPAAQHVALLWDAKRIRATDFAIFGELNPLGAPCQGHLRPGLGARFRFPAGLDLEVVTAHLKSGSDEQAEALRERSVARLPGVFASVMERHRDSDLLVLGDFNTAGCPSCSPGQSADDERRAISAQLGTASDALFVLPNQPGCSHYFSRQAGLLDLAVAPRAMRELGSTPVVHASGLCEELGCKALPHALPAAYRELSDHCPIVVDLLDQDLD
ncbi:MAG TPA: endonuclease/exonuclease/phosphatase family protein [Polyangiaceae bacterium]|nr:endonuclease/exonuclease/phosphatase family protein [Polyangiaceae bacterium]